MFIFLNFLLLSFTYSALAANEDLPPISDNDLFIAPDETNQQETKLLLDRTAPSQGIHLTVGAERAFIGVALNTSATSLNAVDMNPNVVRYNRMNAALLRIANDRTDYIHLRLKATREEIVNRLGFASDQELFEERQFKWWRVVLSQIKFWPLHRLGPLPYDTPWDSLLGANYLYNDVLFNRLSKLAKNGKLRFFLLDLSSTTGLALLNNLIGKEKLSVVDFSNLFTFGYIKGSNIEALVKLIFQNRGRNTVLLQSEYQQAYFYRAIPLETVPDVETSIRLLDEPYGVENHIAYPDRIVSVCSEGWACRCLRERARYYGELK